ncbi:MAG TPA: hypothetical protein VHQ48_12820 [Bradyrhizobium sp.]|jgi:deoxycytidylate deaminase|nr:hypothetical protein [Bradyrhizobium sp.]
MAKAVTKEAPATSDKRVPTSSKNMVRAYASNEFVFAVVGHVGCGTTKIATSLAELLNKGSITGDPFDTEIIKARNLIEAWATENEKAIPGSEPRNLLTTEQFQDLGDEMRAGGDHAAVANRAIQRIRLIRAQKQKMENPGDQPVEPDGSRRAYIIDSIRHPAEVELLRRVYREAFVLIGVVCDAEVRLKRLQSEKYSTASKVDILKFMDRDSRSSEDHGQRVSDAFHMADYFVDNTVQQLLDDGTGNREWDINENLSRLTKIITHTELVRPTIAETAMHEAYGASLRSACLSRQVGAALLDKEGNIIGTGTNEVPKAGGGVYGEHFDEDTIDSRCAFRETGKYCSNTQEQNRIIDEIFNEVKELSGQLAWFLPDQLIEGNKVTFVDDAGKRRRKQLVGWSEKRQIYWHAAFEGRPVAGDPSRLVLRPHVIFTADGKNPIFSKQRMHVLRRSFCKSWWNDRWRDLLIAFALVIGESEEIRLCVGPTEFLSFGMPMRIDSRWVPEIEETNVDEEIDSFDALDSDDEWNDDFQDEPEEPV